MGQIADSLREKCSAVICQNDEIAFLLLRALQARGCMVPQEMSVLCFEESYYSEAGRVPLSVLASLDGRIGTVAAEKLLRMIGRSPESSVRLNWRLVEKGSVSYLG
ncbi:MAG: substrate-binding domain-containing protein [Lachnospiraceae bacterium]|nr:substrate-binding domain-containing protein [Lachnospiraceae bacterium]